MIKKKIRSALISVFDKDKLEPIIQKLKKLNVKIYSTGGTQDFIKNLGYDVIPVEDITSYPSILGGRVKTLHPKVFGGILNRENNELDQSELKKYNIPQIDLVIVDLYPFEDTIKSNASEEEIIEKIDIGGIALIRAAAKNFNDVVCISSKDDYSKLLSLLESKQGYTDLNERKEFAVNAFNTSSHYDTSIYNYFNTKNTILKVSLKNPINLRYGENPHQKGSFYGNLNDYVEQVHGKNISYNNLLDIDSAINLISEFQKDLPSFGIFKHNNACGFSVRNNLKLAYLDSLKADPVSAFGGVLISNKIIDTETSIEINKLFCEILIAPKYEEEALQILKEKKNRIILIQKESNLPKNVIRSCLNGFLKQERDVLTDKKSDLKYVTKLSPDDKTITDLIFASKICKHTKSNTIVLAKNHQLIASGTGQTSRVDALNQSIAKAKKFGFDLNGSVMASDAFFPFPDCVEIAHKAGIKSIIQPGGSIKDQDSIDYCNKNNLSMVFTGNRHFKH